MAKGKWGGKRVGAGRKAAHEVPLAVVTSRVPAPVAEWLKAQVSKGAAPTVSAMICALIEEKMVVAEVKTAAEIADMLKRAMNEEVQ